MDWPEARKVFGNHLTLGENTKMVEWTLLRSDKVMFYCCLGGVGIKKLFARETFGLSAFIMLMLFLESNVFDR